MVTAPETPEAKLNCALELIGGSIDPEIAESIIPFGGTNSGTGT